MNEHVRELIASAAHSFLQKSISGLGAIQEKMVILANPHEELAEAARSGKSVKLFKAGGRALATRSQGAKARLEENYLFDTRRYASGAQAAGENIFFQSAVGQPGVNNGFVSPMIMTELETNMDVAGQIAQGKNFVFNQLGIAFNADIVTSDLILFLESGALRFEKQGGQFTLRHGPLKLWPGGTGAAGYAATAVGGAPLTIQASHNGSADIRAVRRLSIPRIIREKESFAYKHVIPRAVRNLDNATAITLTNAITMSIWLWGGQQDALPI